MFRKSKHLEKNLARFGRSASPIFIFVGYVNTKPHTHCRHDDHRNVGSLLGTSRSCRFGWHVGDPGGWVADSGTVVGVAVSGKVQVAERVSPPAEAAIRAASEMAEAISQQVLPALVVSRDLSRRVLVVAQPG